MKVLITGFTGVQAHASEGQLQLISNIMSIEGALTDLGHGVEWRPVTPGEDLSPYDRCIVAINGVASWVAPFALGGLYVMGARRDTILTMDDWQAPKAFSSGSPDKEKAVVWNPKLNRLHHFDAIENDEVRTCIDNAVEELCYIHYRKLLIPAFANGDLELLGLGAPNAIKYDPSSYMIDRYDYAPDIEKARAWVSAALAPKDSWFFKHSFSWPVEYYGVRRLGQPRVTEAELASIYSQRWGVLSAPHPHAGSGWFRVRFLMAALAGSVVYCDRREADSIHPTYPVGSLHSIETMENEQLRELATHQRSIFLEQCWDKLQLQEFVQTHIVSSGSPEHGVRLFEQPSENADG